MSARNPVNASHALDAPLPCSTLARGSASHKYLDDETALLRFYYTAPYVLFWVCALNELFLVSLFLMSHLPAVRAAT